jgi:demethylmenaquinone methyltransferase/2-methoxy-6-polyprenyl-1,4-benzoquinol methylase
MLRVGRDRLLDEGVLMPALVCDAERLPFATGAAGQGFDLASVAFGLRNMTRKEQALAEMARVLKPGGRLMVLEFSQPAPFLRKPYDWYSFGFMPLAGRLIAGDEASYRYLAESIRMHPDQATLKAMMVGAGFGHVDVHNLAGGIVALHVGIKC